MKRHLLIALLLALTMPGHADIITSQQAAERATEYLDGISTNKQLTRVTSTARLAPRRKAAAKGESTAPAYYVFSRGEGQGYVIVSADDQTDAVLGYTDAGDFDYATLPDNMRAWLDDCEDQLMHLRRVSQTGSDGRARAPRRAAAVPTHPAIPELMTTRWSQGSPYNDECPLDNDGKRCVTGCVATAMAQVMYYQRAKSVDKTTAAIPAYTSWSHQLKVEGIAKGAPIDWDHMRDNGGSSKTERQAVAQLMHYCGVSISMDYTSGSSGAQPTEVVTALTKYFGYGSNPQMVYRSGHSAKEWDALLYNELAHNRPLYLGGYTPSYSMGHAFVCDGYDGKRNFHINWGWGGQSNGYFLLNNLTPGSQGIGGNNDGDGYTDGQNAIINFVPANYSTRAIPFADTSLKKLCVAAWDTNGDGEVSFGEAAKVTDLGTTFKGTRIKTFDELVNCTKLTSIPDDAFAGCVSLTSVALPENLKAIGSRAFAGCRNLKTLRLPETVAEIGDSAFAGCKVLTSIDVGVVREIRANTFEGCAALTAFTVPATVTTIGDKAFAGCTKLKSFTIDIEDPASATFGNDLFQDVDLSQVTLNVPAGTRQFYADDPQWSLFGDYHEERQMPDDQFIPLTTNRQVYLYNVGAKAYLTKGEAWGTQAVVGTEAMRFELRHDDDMPDGQYYLYSDDTGNNKHILFRTISDDKVGSGVKCCFVDGQLSKNAYWTIDEVETNVYRLAAVQGSTGYVKDRYLGIQPDHKTNARGANVTTTMGAYFDVSYATNPTNCQWMLVDVDATYGAYNAATELETLLSMAKTKRVNAEREQATLDNLESTKEQLVQAQRTLRKKLNLIHFDDATFRDVAIANYDRDGDGELSYAEAALTTDFGENFLMNTNVEDLTPLQYFTSVNTIYGNSFVGCTQLRAITLPKGITTMYYRVFENCSSLTELSLPSTLSYIGFNSFQGCTALKTLRIAVTDPAYIQLGADVFKDVDLSAVTLYVPQGSKELYAAADVWKDFGHIEEMRAATLPDFAPIDTEETYIIYNLAAGGFIRNGEAYGTQAVVGNTGFAYQLRRTNSMPENTYYLYSTSITSNNKVLFRTDTDSRVGTGVKACFVDGSVSAKAYWTFAPVEGRENVFTLQVPKGAAGYVEGQYLGVYTQHATNAVEAGDPTYGLYWDIVDGDPTYNADACHWALIRVSDIEAMNARLNAADELATLLGRAQKRGLDVTAEQAVYDDLNATQEQLEAATATLRQRLGYLAFDDDRVKQLCVNRYDLDEDDELTAEELAAATTLGQVFRQNTNIHTFDELRYFTGLTAINADAFRSCTALTKVTIPANVTNIGENAFTGCSKLRFMRIMHPSTAVTADNAGIADIANIFVEADALSAYEAAETWSAYTISAYTGKPVVTARRTERFYGRNNPTFDYAVLGAPTEGVPVLTCQADQKSPVGNYVISVARGTVDEGIELRDGLLIVTPAPLTITARSYQRNVGEENPVFELDYSGFRNRENAETGLTQQPTVTCAATADSPAGEYEITVGGAEAQNYDITYVAGVLTVIDPDGIISPEALAKNPIAAIYATDGKQRANLTKGLNIVRLADGSVRKVLVK